MKVTDLLEMNDRYAEDRDPTEGLDIDYSELLFDATHNGSIMNTLDMLVYNMEDADPNVKVAAEPLDFDDIVSEDEYVTAQDANLIYNFIEKSSGESPVRVVDYVEKMIRQVMFTQNTWPKTELAQEMARGAAEVPDTREQDIPSREERNR